MIRITGHAIGFEEPSYIVAEMSGSHKGNISRAFRILDAAKVAAPTARRDNAFGEPMNAPMINGGLTL